MRAVIWAMVLALAACAAPTRFVTRPAGAAVFVNGEQIGHSPVVYDDGRGLPRRYHVEIYRAGCEPLDFYLDTRMSYGWGLLGKLLLIPSLWAWSLDDRYVFALRGGPDCEVLREDTEPSPIARRIRTRDGIRMPQGVKNGIQRAQPGRHGVRK